MASASEDDVMDNAEDLGDDLFGDEEEGEAENVRELSDRELDSGDDEGRNDRAPRKDEEDVDETAHREARILECKLYRHPLPKPFDGEYNALRLPTFLGIEPRPFDPDSFEIPVSDHHTTTKSTSFSASAIAAGTMRFRKTPSGKLESNTIVYRWSDGSTTISVGDQHYELQSKPLAPPKESKTYQEVQDSHSYFAEPSIESGMLIVVGHMTNQYTVRPNKDIADDALEKLQRSMAAATRGGKKGDEKGGPELITNTQDPELQKKQAEIAEKERMRAQRRRETAAEKANMPVGRRIPGGGLNVDDLEGRAGRRAPAGGRKPAGGAKRQRRRPDYDSEDDLPRGGRSREDEYDKEDDFLASSDEELDDAPGDDDDEEEEMLDDESDGEEPKAKKQKTARTEDISDADADGEADLDDDEVPHAAPEPSGANRRKRNVIEDDDDE